MGGWFRKEIKTIEDLKGLKFRIGGFAGQILAKLGVVPQQIAGGDIYPALEKGTIDAAEWVGPYDDQKLGFIKIAPNYYYPGWWEGNAALQLFINLDKWNDAAEELPGDRARGLRRRQHAGWLPKYDADNPRRCAGWWPRGTKLLPFSQPILEPASRRPTRSTPRSRAKNAELQEDLRLA